MTREKRLEEKNTELVGELWGHLKLRVKLRFIIPNLTKITFAFLVRGGPVSAYIVSPFK